MKLILAIFCSAALALPAAAGAQQQGQPQGQPQLDALLAPIALYPDDVVRLVLDAATAPAEITDAAQWSRNNRGMTGEDSVRAVQAYPWRPSVKALVAYPELLDRMAESPQWTSDLGNAWVAQQAEVLATVQALRQRAYNSGTLRSDQYQTVQPTDQGIVVQPAMPYIYYVPYYDPLVVYGGGWWWSAYRPVYWRPWYARPVFVTHVAVVNRGFHTQPHFFPQPHGFVARPQAVGRPSPAVQMQNRTFQNRVAPSSFHAPVQVTPYHRVPEAQRAPIVQSRAAPPPARLSYHAPSGGGRPPSGGPQFHGGQRSAGGPSGGGHSSGAHGGGGHSGGGHGRS